MYFFEGVGVVVSYGEGLVCLKLRGVFFGRGLL